MFSEFILSRHLQVLVLPRPQKKPETKNEINLNSGSFYNLRMVYGVANLACSKVKLISKRR